MMNVLIVDDEKMIRTGIKAVVPWKAIGINEIFMAASGKEALQIVKQEEPSLIITDIQMAEMTGLELIAEIRKIQSNVQIIVLTGYDEFDYARQCLRMQVQEFLLKPVDEEMLINTIKKQIQSIRNLQKEEEEQKHMRRIFGTKEQMALEKQMRRLVKGEKVAETVEAICSTYAYGKDSNMRIAIVMPAVYSYRIREGESESLSVLTIKNLLISYLDAKNRGITFEDTRGRILLALFKGEKSDEMERYIDTFIGLVENECNVKLRIVMGEMVGGFSQIYRSYNDAVYLLEKEKDAYKVLIERKESKGQLDMFREVYTDFINSINANIGNTKAVLRIFDAFCMATNSYNITDEYVRKCCFDIASTVYFGYVVESGNYADGKLNTLLASLLSVDRKENYKITRVFLENLLNIEEDEANEFIGRVKSYIKEHLIEDISVAGIADYFYLSPNYFSRLFKRITSERCNEYIVRKRMEKAEYLLATTNMKLGCIASEVGYRDTNYFSLAFKRYMGMSPGRYREQKHLSQKM